MLINGIITYKLKRDKKEKKMYKNWYEKEADINYRNEMIKASIDILIDKIQDYQWNIDTIKEEILEEKR